MASTRRVKKFVAFAMSTIAVLVIFNLISTPKGEVSAQLGNYQGVPSGKAHVDSENKPKWDMNIVIVEGPESEKSVEIKPVQTINPPPQLVEQLERMKEEMQKPLTGVFATELELAQTGDEVILEIGLKNISGQELKLQFDVGREFDITVTDNQGEVVYNRFYGKDVFLPAISSHPLKAGEELSYSDVWNYKDNHGNLVPPGKYQITAKLLPMIEYKRNFSEEELTAVSDLEIHF